MRSTWVAELRNLVFACLSISAKHGSMVGLLKRVPVLGGSYYNKGACMNVPHVGSSNLGPHASSVTPTRAMSAGRRGRISSQGALYIYHG